jgi:predicted small secreted protein
MSTVLELTAVAKTFTMHLQGGIRLPVVAGVEFAVRAGECVVLAGRSGAGKSSILKMIFGTYRCDEGSIRVHADGSTVDVATAEPRQILRLRARTLGYVSQFLRAVPRVPTVDVVAELLVIAGCSGTMPGAGRPISFVGSTFRSAFGRCRRRRSLGVSSSASTSPASLYRMCRFFCSTNRPPRSTPATVRWLSTWWPKRSGAGRPSWRSYTTTMSAPRSRTP